MPMGKPAHRLCVSEAPSRYTLGVATTLNKPAGLPVFPPHDNAEGDCLLRRLLADQPERKDVAWPVGFEGGIAHRLDTATSGAVLAADDLPDLTRLRQWFTEHRLIKTYLMLAAADVPWNSNVCDKPIAHHPRKRDRMVVQRGKQTPHRGKWYPAHSEFVRRAGRLWEVRITTGVTHQVRVHAAFLGIPIVGDAIYGGARGGSLSPLLRGEGKPLPSGAGEGSLVSKDEQGGPHPSRLPRGASGHPLPRGEGELTISGFFLHHLGVLGPEGFRSQAVADPPWARIADRDAP